MAANEALWGKWVAQNLPYQWPGRSLSQTSCRGWAQATFLPLAVFEALDAPGLGPVGLRSFRAEKPR